MKFRPKLKVRSIVLAFSVFLAINSSVAVSDDNDACEQAWESSIDLITRSVIEVVWKAGGYKWKVFVTRPDEEYPEIVTARIVTPEDETEAFLAFEQTEQGSCTLIVFNDDFRRNEIFLPLSQEFLAGAKIETKIRVSFQMNPGYQEYEVIARRKDQANGGDAP